MSAIDDRQTISGVGRCGTKLNAGGTAILVSCIEAGKPPSCATYFLEHISSGRRNPEIVRCSPDYRPIFALSDRDAMRRFGVAVPFRDPAGLGHFPVNGPLLREARVVMRIYRAEDHFTRQVVIPDIRLRIGCLNRPSLRSTYRKEDRLDPVVLLSSGSTTPGRVLSG